MGERGDGGEHVGGWLFDERGDSALNLSDAFTGDPEALAEGIEGLSADHAACEDLG